MLLAQAPAIVSVLNNVSGDARLSPGVVAQIRYVPIAPSDLKDYNSVSVNLGGYRAANLGISADASGAGIVTAVLPRELAVGGTNLTITTSRGTSSPFRIVLSAYAPAFLPPWTQCASDSQIGYINGVGLGATSPPLPSFGYPPLGQTYPTVVKPDVTVAGIPAEVQSSLGYPLGGEYQITFKVSPDTPEGIQPVVVAIGGFTSNAANLLVGVHHWSGAFEAYGDYSGPALPEAIQTAPESILITSSCAVPLANAESVANPRNPPTALHGTTVTLTDSTGAERQAPILSVSPRQVKYIVPAGSANGRALLTVMLDDRVVATSPLDIDTVQPFVFPARNMYLIRIRDGVRTMEPIPTVGWFGEGMIDLGPETDQVFLVMAATGLRNRSSLAQVILRLGFDLPAQYAGPQTDYPGLDQVNIPLRRFPPGTVSPDDRVRAQLLVDGKTSNLTFYFMQADPAK